MKVYIFDFVYFKAFMKKNEKKYITYSVYHVQRTIAETDKRNREFG